MEIELVREALAASKQIQTEAHALRRPRHESVQPTYEPVLPSSIVKGTRGYIESIVNQINLTYDASCFDACSVMIRRLVETLIVEAFESHKLTHLIQDHQGNFVALADLINAVTTCTSWNLGRVTRTSMGKLKSVGDLSAHSRRYLAHRTDIDKLIDPLRVVTQELVMLARLK